MNTPPPLPAATSFVTVLARISLVLAALGVAWALAQMLFALLLPEAAVARLAADTAVDPVCGFLARGSGGGCAPAGAQCPQV